MDYGHEQTEKELKKLERKISQEYQKAYEEARAKADKYFKEFRSEDAEKWKAVKAGKIKKADYMKWRQAKMLTGSRWDDMASTLAVDMVNADKIAVAVIRERLPDTYALNANYGAYEVESGLGINTGWTLYDHSTVENLMRDDPQIIPQPRLDIPKDMRWNRQKIVSAITQGVLQGDSIPNIAKRLQSVTNMDKAAAIRNARTYTTAAENKGRVDSYERAKELGIELEQEWLATPDGRTRDSHVDLDGERIPVGGTFSNGCRYPGDPGGSPEEVYNCRCTLVAAIKGHQYHDDRFMRLPEGMTYEDWKEGARNRLAEKRAGEIAEKAFSERVHEIMDKAFANSGELSMGEIKAVGKVFADEIQKNYLGVLQRELDEAQEQLNVTGELERIAMDDKMSEIKKVKRGLMTPEEAGFSSIQEADLAYQEAFAKWEQIVTSPEYNAAMDRLVAAQEAIGNREAHRAFMRDKIGEVREVGIGDIDIAKHLNRSRSPVRKSVEEAYDCYPHAWVRRSVASGNLSPKKVDRGYYDNYNKIIAISGWDKESRFETAVHELGHRFERVVPGIRQSEKEFYESRTAGQSLEWLGSGYARSEVTRKDDFLHPYMGKDYGGSAYELVSMGFEYAYTDPAKLAKDPDMQSWILGLLLTQ